MSIIRASGLHPTPVKRRKGDARSNRGRRSYPCHGWRWHDRSMAARCSRRAGDRALSQADRTLPLARCGAAPCAVFCRKIRLSQVRRLPSLSATKMTDNWTSSHDFRQALTPPLAYRPPRYNRRIACDIARRRFPQGNGGNSTTVTKAYLVPKPATVRPADGATSMQARQLADLLPPLQPGGGKIRRRKRH